ncbi:MAG: hypothetical protein ABMB14_22985 [Myxococcota bacterium]
MRGWVVRMMVLAPLPGCLSYEQFLERKSERYCDELANCNPNAICAEPTGTDTGYAADLFDCAFDAKAARACLNGTWTCNTEFGAEFAYPIGPAECALVCGAEVVE